MERVKAPHCRRCHTIDPRRFAGLATRECRSCKAERLATRTAHARTLAKNAQVAGGQKARKPESQKSGRRDSAHLAFVRTFPCCTPGCRQPAPSEAHHHRLGTDGGAGLKPSDKWAVPLCHAHHAEGHQIGWRTFEKRHEIDLKAQAEFLQRIGARLRPALTYISTLAASSGQP